MICVVPTGQTCPTVQSTNEEDCVNECSSDDDCQYDRICCSNGCGGKSCSDSDEKCEVRSIVIVHTVIAIAIAIQFLSYKQCSFQ